MLLPFEELSNHVSGFFFFLNVKMRHLAGQSSRPASCAKACLVCLSVKLGCLGP